VSGTALCALDREWLRPLDSWVGLAAAQSVVAYGVVHGVAVVLTAVIAHRSGGELSPNIGATTAGL